MYESVAIFKLKHTTMYNVRITMEHRKRINLFCNQLVIYVTNKNTKQKKKLNLNALTLTLFDCTPIIRRCHVPVSNMSFQQIPKLLDRFEDVPRTDDLVLQMIQQPHCRVAYDNGSMVMVLCHDVLNWKSYRKFFFRKIEIIVVKGLV